MIIIHTCVYIYIYTYICVVYIHAHVYISYIHIHLYEDMAECTFTPFMHRDAHEREEFEAVRPVRLLRVWISEGLTQADS